MRVFEYLRAVRAFERQQLGFLRTIEDHHLACEIGYHQLAGTPLTLKQLFLLEVGSVATVQRRLRRLRHLGVVAQRRSPVDRRATEITLTARAMKAFDRYLSLLPSEGAEQPRRTVESTERTRRTAAAGSAASRHMCGIYEGRAGRQRLASQVLAEALGQGETCVVVAPAAEQEALAAGLDHPRRRATDSEPGEHLLVTEGEATPEAQLAFLKSVFSEARRSGRSICLVGDMSWTLERRLGTEGLLRVEKDLEALTRQFSVNCLCLYDASRFQTKVVLKAVKSHKDAARFPIAIA